MVKVAAGWLAVLALVRCGGESTRTVDDAGGAASGANGGTGGTTPAPAGNGGTAGSVTGGASGAVSASGGSSAVDGGVADCTSSRLYCCDRSTGAWVASECDASGIASCPSDSTKIEPGGVCAPVGYDVTSCDELDLRTCSDVTLECHNAERCSWFCNCESHPGSDLPLWSCRSYLC